MAVIQITPIMKTRLEFLKEFQPAQYQRMKDNGTLTQHLMEAEQTFLDRWSSLKIEMKENYNETHEKKIYELPWAEMAVLNDQFMNRSKEIAQEEVLFKKI